MSDRRDATEPRLVGVLGGIGLALFLFASSGTWRTAEAVPQSPGAADNWLFGFGGAGLRFTTGPNVSAQTGPGSTPMNTLEGCATVSDATGALVLYTDGSSLWDSAGTQTINGTLGGGSSSTQSGILVPQPGGTTTSGTVVPPCERYFVFAVSAMSTATSNPPDQKLSCTHVDKNGNRLSGTATTPLRSKVAEKLTACPKADGSGYWVIAHGFDYNYVDPQTGAPAHLTTGERVDSTYFVYEVTVNSTLSTIAATERRWEVGSPHVRRNPAVSGGAGAGLYGGSAGQMKVSPDGTRIACAVSTGFVEVLGFDASQGQVLATGRRTWPVGAWYDTTNKKWVEPAAGDPTDPASVDNSGFTTCPQHLPIGLYGLEFSENSRVLYVTTLSTAPNGNNLYQMNLSSGSSALWLQIGEGDPKIRTHTAFVKQNDSDPYFDYGQLQLAPDHRIYLARNVQSKVSFIAVPDTPGTNCSFDDTGVPLPNTTCCGLGLPALIGGEHGCACEGLFVEESRLPPCGYHVGLHAPPGYAVTSVTYTVDAGSSAAGAQIASIASSPTPTPNNLAALTHSTTGTLAFSSGVSTTLSVDFTGSASGAGPICVDLVIQMQAATAAAPIVVTCRRHVCWQCAGGNDDPCAGLVQDGDSDPCCGYHLTLAAPTGWGVQKLTYDVSPTTQGATITGVTTNPTPSTIGATTATHGVLNYAPPAQGPLQFHLAAVTTSSNGHVCVDLKVRLSNPTTHQWRECPVQICFDCCTTVLPRCDKMSWEPCPLCCELSLSTRDFTIVNDKVPVSDICGVTISFSPAPTTVIGGGLHVDSSPLLPWPSGWSTGFTQIHLGTPDQADGTSGHQKVNFNLAVPPNYLGDVTVTSIHCDGTSCVQKWPWSGEPGPIDPTMNTQRVRAVSHGKELRGYRLEFSPPRLHERRIRWIGIDQAEEAGSIVAITGASSPCGKAGGPCDELVESTQVRGSRGMIKLRRPLARGDLGAPFGVTVLYTPRGRAPASATLTFFDVEGVAVARSPVTVEEPVPTAEEPQVGPPLPTPMPTPTPTPVPSDSSWPVQYSGAGIETGRGSLTNAVLVPLNGPTLEIVRGAVVAVGRDDVRTEDIARIDFAWSDTLRGRAPSATVLLKDGRSSKTGPLIQYSVEVAVPGGGAKRLQWQLRGRPGSAPELEQLLFLNVVIELPPVDLDHPDRDPRPPRKPSAPPPVPTPLPAPTPLPDPGSGRPRRATGNVQFEGLGDPSSGTLTEFQVVAESGEVLAFVPGAPVTVGQERINWDFINMATMKWESEGPTRRLSGVDVQLVDGRVLSFPARGGIRQIVFGATAADGRPVRFAASAARWGLVKTPLTRVVFLHP